MRALIILLLLSPFISQSQVKPNPDIDSLNYFSRELGTMTKQTYDSLRNSTRYKTTVEKINYYKSHSDRYIAFALFGEVAGANFSKLNASIVPNGFTALNGPIYRFGLGVSNKSDGVIVDINFFIFGIDKKSKKGDEKITGSFSNLFQFDFGYDLVKSQKVNIFPYAGLSLRTSSISYDKPAQTNGSYTDISNIILNQQSVSGTTLKAGYQAGIGFDFVTDTRSDKMGGTIFFIKVGTNGSIGKETYKIDDVKYVPGIKYGSWIVTAGIKFFSRG